MTATKVLIAGGGSAGWMAAAYLDAALNREGRRRAEIGVVESPDVPRIGVGEATVPSINHILAVVGIDQHEFMRRVDGTFKQAIKYVGWLHGQGEHYYHPFNRFRESPIDRTGLRWLRSRRDVAFAETVSAQPAICELNLAPQALDPRATGRPLAHAFHMNAQKFADCLTGIATARGVRHYRDHITGVDLAGDGNIQALRTQGGGRLEADLFIDCTGFAALLMERHLGVGWVDCSQWLMCNRALTLQVPYTRHFPGFVRPYTTATAMSSGWTWDIPLQDKRSLGYVHAEAFLDSDAAERELRTHAGEHANGLDTRLIEFKVGHREKAWVRNCVAIGLAGSFIEPLESTGLYLSDLAAVMLAEHFPRGNDMAPLAYRFNRIMANRFYEVLDFINMHYCLSRRSDTPFWREVTRSERINGRLRAKLSYWTLKPPSPSDFEDQCLPGQPQTPLPSGGYPGDHRSPVDTGDLFGIDSYEAILYGMDFLRGECDEWYGDIRPATRIAAPVAERVRTAAHSLPPHHIWLQKVLGMPAYADASRR